MIAVDTVKGQRCQVYTLRLALSMRRHSTNDSPAVFDRNLHHRRFAINHTFILTIDHRNGPYQANRSQVHWRQGPS